MAVLISSAFGATCFFFVLAVYVRTMKPVPTSTRNQHIPNCSAIPFRTAQLQTGSDAFLPFGVNPELALPKITLRVQHISALPVAEALKVSPVRLRQHSRLA